MQVERVYVVVERSHEGFVVPGVTHAQQMSEFVAHHLVVESGYVKVYLYGNKMSLVIIVFIELQIRKNNFFHEYILFYFYLGHFRLNFVKD